jgi:hypothetical protein
VGWRVVSAFLVWASRSVGQFCCSVDREREFAGGAGVGLNSCGVRCWFRAVRVSREVAVEVSCVGGSVMAWIWLFVLHLATSGAFRGGFFAVSASVTPFVRTFFWPFYPLLNHGGPYQRSLVAWFGFYKWHFYRAGRLQCSISDGQGCLSGLCGLFAMDL